MELILPSSVHEWRSDLTYSAHKKKWRESDVDDDDDGDDDAEEAPPPRKPAPIKKPSKTPAYTHPEFASSTGQP